MKFDKPKEVNKCIEKDKLKFQFQHHISDFCMKIKKKINENQLNIISNENEERNVWKKIDINISNYYFFDFFIKGVFLNLHHGTFLSRKKSIAFFCAMVFLFVFLWFLYHGNLVYHGTQKVPQQVGMVLFSTMALYDIFKKF